MDTKNVILELRVKNGLSQEELAEKVGISVTHMSHIETGNTKLSLPVLVELASVLGVGTDVLLLSDGSGSERSRGTLSAVLKDCNERELATIADIVKAAKNALRKHENE